MLGRGFMAGAKPQVPPGQVQWTTAGLYAWTVPAGVTEISGVVVGGGAGGGFGGGGLHWRNTIAVTPGEVLAIQVGSNDIYSGASIESHLKRGANYLLRADRATYHSQYGGGGGNGGTGGSATRTGGGGAGGYMGNGGNGDSTPNKNPPQLNSGGGYSGPIWSDGDGVGLQGRTANFAPGSLGSPKCGGGLGEGQSSGPGGVRLMWGEGRSYPDNAADVTA